MKKIINGRLYDTDTAKELGCWANTWDSSDAYQVRETLYVKRTGEHFIYAEGGALSPLGGCMNGTAYPGWKFTPITDEEAQEWSEEKLTADEYQELYGPVSEGPELKKVTFELSPKELKALRCQASESGTTVSDLLNKVVSDFLNNQEDD